MGSFRVGDASKLIEIVQQVGERLISAQPRELAIGNVVRRVLGVIREEAEEDREGETSGYSDTGSESQPHPPIEDSTTAPTSAPASRTITSSPLRHVSEDPSSVPANAGPAATSMFSLLSHPVSISPAATPGNQSPANQTSLSTQALANLNAAKDLRAEVIEGIEEILEELRQADDQIAGYALEHIHSNEIILTHTASKTVQKFLLKAATKRKFTVVHAETYPNDHEATHAAIVGKPKGDSDAHSGADHFQKTLTAAGIIVILIPDSAVFAMMSRVNKVILDTHIVLANGSLVAAAGARAIAKAANIHRTPIVVLSGVYKLSPVYPFDLDALMEDGDPGKIVPYEDGEFLDKVEVENPLFDYVPADLVDLYITNL